MKLIDFGLADTDSHALLKQPAGTMRYMAPEQARLAQADVRNDIYSLGVIMQEMNRVQGGAVPRRIVERCLAPIDQRWQDMDQLCDALRQSQRRRRNMMVAAAALTVAAVVAGLVWQIGKLRRQADDMDSRAALMSHQLRVLNREIIDFDDEQVHRKCIDHWDADGDGELSYDEAAAVTSLGQVFTADTTITAFNELEHFTGLEEIGHDAIQSHAIDSIYIPAATTSLTSTSLLSCGHLRRVVVSPQNPVYDSRDDCNGIVVTATNQLLTGFPGTRIPRSVTSLSDEAFNSLDLEELTIPAQITRIGPWSLVSRIGRIYLESPVPPAYDSEGGQLSIVAYGVGLYPNPDVYVPIGSLEAYAKADGWNRLAHLMREYPAAPCRVPLWPHVSASLTTFVPMHSNGSNFPALMP